jgi:carbamoyl-phosphate synthase large subunit
MGFKILATRGTADFLTENGVPCGIVHKVSVARPNGIDLIKNAEVQLLINTPLGKRAQKDDYTLRQAAIAHRIAYTTTLSAASAACDAIQSLKNSAPTVRSIQEWQATIQ